MKMISPKCTQRKSNPQLETERQRRLRVLVRADKRNASEGLPSSTPIPKNLVVDGKTRASVDRFFADEIGRRANKLLTLEVQLRSGGAGNKERQVSLQLMNGETLTDVSRVVVLEARLRELKDAGLAPFSVLNARYIAGLGASLGLVLPYWSYVRVLQKRSTRKPVCELVVDGTRSFTSLLALSGERDEVVDRLLKNVCAYIRRH